MKKSAKIKKKITKKELIPTERHFDVLLENIDSKIDLVVESNQALDKNIEDFKTEVNERFNNVDYKFEVIFEKFDDITDELRVIRNELKEKVGRDEFILLEKRVLMLEKAKR